MTVRNVLAQGSSTLVVSFHSDQTTCLSREVRLGAAPQTADWWFCCWGRCWPTPPTWRPSSWCCLPGREGGTPLRLPQKRARLDPTPQPDTPASNRCDLIYWGQNNRFHLVSRQRLFGQDCLLITPLAANRWENPSLAISWFWSGRIYAMREGQSAGKRLKLTLHCAGGAAKKCTDRSIEAVLAQSNLYLLALYISTLTCSLPSSFLRYISLYLSLHMAVQCVHLPLSSIHPCWLQFLWSVHFWSV